jgi:hypothetical protein
MSRPGGLTFASGLIVAFLCACLLVASASALAASDAAQAASAKAKRAKACKKGKKTRSATRKASACRKRDGDRPSLPAPPRTVTLTWDSSADIDLQVYDQSGHRSGPFGGGMVEGIPGATHSANDTDGFGPETFEDPSGRRVGYLACWVSGPHANVTLTDSGKGGGQYTASLGPTSSPPIEAYSTSVGWGYLPIAAHC